MNPLLRSSDAHVVVDSLDAPQLADADEHHLRRVLRLRPGAAVSLTDGRGSWRPARTIDHGGVLGVEATGPQHTLMRSTACVWVAVPKGDRLEWMVQKLTELGVATIGLLECSRSVVQWDRQRGERQLERLGRIAREALSQSRGAWLPTIVAPTPPSGVAVDRTWLVAEPGGLPWAELVDARAGAVPGGILIGPEGGFTPDELADVTARGAAPVSLAPTVLRVETAAIAAAAAMAATIVTHP